MTGQWSPHITAIYSLYALAVTVYQSPAALMLTGMSRMGALEAGIEGREHYTPNQF